MSTLTQFQTRVKAEYRLNGDDDTFDPLILNFTNQAFLAYVKKTDHPDFLLVDQEVACADATSSVDLPEDFLRLSGNFIKFKQDDNIQWQLFRQNNPRIGVHGFPVCYRRSSLTIYLRPFDAIVASNAIVLDYFAKPTVLVAPDDDLPSLTLEDWAFYEVMAKLALYHESDRYGKYKQEANIKFVESRAEVQ